MCVALASWHTLFSQGSSPCWPIFLSLFRYEETLSLWHERDMDAGRAPVSQVSGWVGAKTLHHTGSGEAYVYTGMMDCFVRTVREEGFRALFKVRVEEGGWRRGGWWTAPSGPCRIKASGRC